MLASHDIREAITDEDLGRFAEIRVAASPRDWVTPPKREPDRLILLSGTEGCGLAARSSLDDCVTVQIYVRPDARSKGIGEQLWRALVKHAYTLNRPFLFSTVDSEIAEGVEFATARGFIEIGREIEAHRRIGFEPEPKAIEGIRVVSVAERPELLEAAWHAVGADGYADIPLPSNMTMTLDLWLEEEAQIPEGSFVALEGDRIVGYAGMMADEHGLTCVAQTHRGRGIGTLLKSHQLAWAAGAGREELVSYTQGLNLAMQRVNEKLGYEIQPAWLKMRRPLSDQI